MKIFLELEKAKSGLFIVCKVDKYIYWQLKKEMITRIIVFSRF